MSRFMTTLSRGSSPPNTNKRATDQERKRVRIHLIFLLSNQLSLMSFSSAISGVTPSINFPQYHQTSFKLHKIESTAVVLRSDPILTALRIPCSLRKENDLQPIIEFVKGLKFFHSFSSYPETVAQIAEKLELQSYVNGSHIFHEGEVGSHFYVILDGEVSIYKRKRLQSMETVSENVLLVKLGCGQHFGETALESKDGLRTASAIASKSCNLLVLHRDDYLHILSSFKILLKIAVKKALQMPSSIFNHLPENTIDTLSDIAVVRSFAPNSIIYLSGTRISSLMIVKSGLVKLIKPISKIDFEESVKESEKKIKLIRNSVLNYTRIHSSPPKTLRSSSAIKTNKPFSPHHNNHRVLTPLDTRKETPSGHWILTRSEDYVAKNKLHLAPSNYMMLSSSLPDATGTGSGYVRRLSLANTNGLAFTPKSAQQVDRFASNEQEEFTMGVLMSGDVLGEVSILDADNITPITAIASTAVELYCIDVEVLIELGIPRDEKIMRCLLDDWKFRNPPVSEIRKKVQVKYEWEIKKKAILQDLRR